MLDTSLILPLMKIGSPGGKTESPANLGKLITEPWLGELHIAHVFDLEDRFQYVTTDDCARLGIKPDELPHLRVHNLMHRRGKPRIVQGTHRIGFLLGGDLEASLLLVDALWDQIEPQIPGELIAAVPARDMLMVTGSQVEGGVEALVQNADQVWEDMKQRQDERLKLTRSLLVRRDGKWRLKQ
ncbi:hypothetical protein DZF91_35980 [Actinomadura logoneensis]|uniref:Uncharacterized protein n=2 Tax=Actinomadura logoneensis TaxID=2293572 RepID=A0A372JAL2_9ACTN|nr:hypothetical protein DZF91_35980 [Actinomadura logoneensis]